VASTDTHEPPRVQAIVLAYETGLFDADAGPPVNQDERRAR